MFEADLAEYREKGAEALKGKLDGLVSRALDESATENFRHFVADLCMDLKDYQRALEVLLANDKAGALTDVGYNNMALCYWELGREEDAYFAYKKSLAINSENVSSLRGACYLAIEKGHDQEALDFCRSFYTASPDDREAAIWYATALHNADQSQELRQLVERWEGKFGRDPELEGF